MRMERERAMPGPAPQGPQALREGEASGRPRARQRAGSA